MKTLLVTLSIGSVLWLAGCATHKSDSSVARTLDSYQVGKTTFADLKHDSDLAEGQKTVSALAQPASNPPQMVPRTIATYDLPRHSHWRIFNTHDQSTCKNGALLSSSRELTMGNTERPLYVLTFNSAGMLIDKKPAS